MFFDWYEVESGEGALGFGGQELFEANAWQAFGIIDLLLFLVAAAAIARAVLGATRAAPAVRAPLGLAVAGGGALALLLLVFRFLAVPDSVAPDVEGIDADRQLGLYLGVLLTAALAGASAPALLQFRRR